MQCLAVSDLHGRASRYETLFRVIRERLPGAVFLGGDLLPLVGVGKDRPFDLDDIEAGFEALRSDLGADYPAVFVILGNDDPRSAEPEMLAGEARGLWTYLHMRSATLGEVRVYGYSCVPPTPFQLKDWERYDVSRYVDPGCVSPEEGRRSVPVPEGHARHRTIAEDLSTLCGEDDLSRSVLLTHTPPYRTALDRAALDGRMIDHVPLDVHIGSIALQRFLEERQPLVSLHGHVHESTRLTGAWRERVGRTHAFQAAHDGPELSLVTFSPADPGSAARELLEARSG